MGFEEHPNIANQAERDFNRMRLQAFWSNIWAKVRGDNTDLLNFEEVKLHLRLQDERYLGLRDIPLDHIVGSVGRYNDFTRQFLPKKTVNRERWKAVDSLALGLTGFPPIEVYKVGEAYFVLDGNHRVSVARANGMASIEGYVTEYRTDVPFEKDTELAELALKAEYAYFLRRTRLKALRPDAQDILLTELKRYPEILEHIDVHHYFRGLDCECPIAWDDSVLSWYDNIYLPMVNAIQEQDMLANFPNRTEADMYVWMIRHQAEIQDAYGSLLSPDEIASDFLEKSGT